MRIDELNDRSRAIFRRIVEAYLETGDPVGSRRISLDPDVGLSAASVRNVMADLEDAGLLQSPHTSAGRLPTDMGLRLFVDGLLHMGDLTTEERAEIESRCIAKGIPTEEALAQATAQLSGLSQCAGMITVPKASAPLRHIEFIELGERRGLVVLVFQDGTVENRLIGLPAGLPPSALVRAGNFLNRRLEGHTFESLRALVADELASSRDELDKLAADVVSRGLATQAGKDIDAATLIVRGRANLLGDKNAVENLEKIRQLFDDLESKKDLLKLIDLACEGEGVRIFIGAENPLFSLSGSSVVIAPYRSESGRVLGAVGVIGPTRINYARVIPLVDFTAQVVGRLL